MNRFKKILLLSLFFLLSCSSKNGEIDLIKRDVRKILEQSSSYYLVKDNIYFSNYEKKDIDDNFKRESFFSVEFLAKIGSDFSEDIKLEIDEKSIKLFLPQVEVLKIGTVKDSKRVYGIYYKNSDIGLLDYYKILENRKKMLREDILKSGKLSYVEEVELNLLNDYFRNSMGFENIDILFLPKNELRGLLDE